MGWNDHYDPSTYDPADQDSMRALANRARRERPPVKPTREQQAWLDSLPVGDCEECSYSGRLVNTYQCATCWHLDKYGY